MTDQVISGFVLSSFENTHASNNSGSGTYHHRLAVQHNRKEKSSKLRRHGGDGKSAADRRMTKPDGYIAPIESVQ